jgi:hypothetical protein
MQNGLADFEQKSKVTAFKKVTRPVRLDVAAALARFRVLMGNGRASA